MSVLGSRVEVNELRGFEGVEKGLRTCMSDFYGLQMTLSNEKQGSGQAQLKILHKHVSTPPTR